MKSKSWLPFVPAYWAALFDIVITITHQSKEYWQGDLTKANEGNPFGAYMMANHVSGIFIVCFVWLVVIGLVGRLLPERYSRMFLLFVLVVHSWGGSSWLSNQYGFWSVIVFILFNSVLYRIVEENIQKQGLVTVRS